MVPQSMTFLYLLLDRRQQPFLSSLLPVCSIKTNHKLVQWAIFFKVLLFRRLCRICALCNRTIIPPTILIWFSNLLVSTASSFSSIFLRTVRSLLAFVEFYTMCKWYGEDWKNHPNIMPIQYKGLCVLNEWSSVCWRFRPWTSTKRIGISHSIWFSIFINLFLSFADCWSMLAKARHSDNVYFNFKMCTRDPISELFGTGVSMCSMFKTVSGNQKAQATTYG